jgi:hypothetical protein
MTDAAPVVAAPVSTPASANPAPTPSVPATPAPAGSNAPSGQETPRASAPPAPEMFDVKINGKTVKMSREDVIRRAQISEAATERFEQAAAKEKHINGILAGAKQNPIGALMNIGLSKDEAREAFEAWYSSEYIEPEALSPEQREIKAYKEKLARYEKQEAETKAQQKHQQEEQEIAAHREVLQKRIIDTIEEHGLPKTSVTVGRMAYYMKLAQDKGFEAPMDLIAQQVKQEQERQLGEIPEGADYGYFVKTLGETLVKRVISEHLKHIRTQRAQPGAIPIVDAKSKKDPVAGKVSMADAERNLKKLMGRP